MRQYLSLLAPFGDVDDATINTIGAVTAGGDAILTPVRVSATHYAFVPGPEFCPRLYRGQNKDYGTCKAGTYRQRNRYGDLIYRKLKQIELLYLIERHPATIELFHYWTINGLRLDMSLNAMAQHYGHKTDIVDLTRSRNVAMFFATHKYCRGEWQPAVGQKAVLYTIDIARLVAGNHSLFPIGIDPFPRPYAQRAFGLQLAMHEDLTRLDGVTVDNFIVTEQMADEALERAGGLHGLFPDDPFELLIDEQIRQRHVHLEAIGRAYLMGEIPDDLNYGALEHHLKAAGYRITRSPIAIPSDDVLAAAQESWEELRQEFWRSIRFRFVSEHVNALVANL